MIDTDCRTIAIRFITEAGNFDAELFPEKAPVTVANFLANLATGLYENGCFHRAALSNQRCRIYDRDLAIDVIEASKSEDKKDRFGIKHESNKSTGLQNKEGYLSMSRDEPGSAKSDFFINLGNNSVLDDFGSAEHQDSGAGFATFGRITKGMEVVKNIHLQPSGGKPMTNTEKNDFHLLSKSEQEVAEWCHGQSLDAPVMIKTILVI